MPKAADVEREWLTRKSRIDPKLDAVGWRLRPGVPGGAFRSEEFETDAGPPTTCFTSTATSSA